MFVEGLYNIIDCGNYSDFISWSETGMSFFIWNKELFTKNALKKFTTQNHFASFERQLNMYNFDRMSDGRSKRKSEEYKPIEFGHAYFQRGRKELLKYIKRRLRSPVDSTYRKKPISYRKRIIRSSRQNHRSAAVGKQREQAINYLTGLLTVKYSMTTESNTPIELGHSIANLSLNCNTHEPIMTHVAFMNNFNENNLLTSLNLQHNPIKPEYAHLESGLHTYSPYNLNSILIILNTLGIDVNTALCDPWMTELLISLINQLNCTPDIKQ